MPSLKHSHKYRMHVYPSGYKVYFCALPNCTHKIETVMTLGKTAVCWRCGKDFVMNEYSVTLVKPHCQACHKYKNGPIDVVDTIEIPSLIERRELPEIDFNISLKDRLLHSIGQTLSKEDEANKSEDDLL